MDYHAVLKANPNDLVALEQSAGIYFERGQFSRALEHYNVLVELNPSQGGYYYNRAVIYEKLGQVNAALQNVTKASALGFNLASIYIEKLKSLKNVAR